MENIVNPALKELQDELEQELLGNILPFWSRYMPDLQFGGFYGHLTHDNQVLPEAGKGAVLNARILWTFSAAFRLYGIERDREMAHRACQFIMDHFLDREMGGVYWELDHRGRVKESRKQIYALAFTIYGLTEYHRVFGNQEALETAIRLFSDIEQHALDRQRKGYTEALTRDWKQTGDLRLSDRDANERKTMNTHLHILEGYTHLYRVWKEPRLAVALQDLVELFLEKFINPGTFHLNLFFDDNWKLKSDFISFGHDIECSWLLHEAASVLGREELVAKTGRMAVQMAEASISGLGMDGGLFYERFGDGATDTDRHWWPQAEALVGYFNAWQLSGDETFLQHATGVWQFIREKMVDRKYGEWYWSVNRDGIPRTEREKAGFWKGPYHNGRACMELITRIGEINGTRTPASGDEPIKTGNNE
jgi:cellobiose epimerase